LIVFKPQMGDAWGVLVERIGDMVELTTRQIESHRAGGDGDRQHAGLLPQEELVHGVGKLDGHLLLILDACRLPSLLEHAIERRDQALFSHRNKSKERSL
jgi:chemotaxis signal transduction protein